MARTLFTNFLGRQPQCAQATVVERASGFLTQCTRDECKAQVGGVPFRMLPTVDTEQGGWFDMPGGFFQRLADDGVY